MKTGFIEESLDSTRRVLLRFVRRIDDAIYEKFGPIKVLFVVKNEFGFACQYPIIRALSRNNNVKVAVTSDYADWLPEFSDPNLDDCYWHYFLCRSRALLGKFHFIFHTDMTSSYFRRNAVHCVLSHGSAFGNLDKERVDWSTAMIAQKREGIYFCSSPNVADILRKSDPKILGSVLLIPVGFPKLDDVVNGVYDRGEVLRSFDLPVDRKTILLTSHWNDNSILRVWGSQVLDVLTRFKDDCNVIVTGHGKLWELPSGTDFNPHELWGELKSYENQINTVKIVKAENIGALLSVADVLVGDSSSVVVEFSALDRPIVFFDRPGLNFYSERVQALYRESAFCWSHIVDLYLCCKQALTLPDLHAEGREMMRDYFFRSLGQSAGRVADAITEIGRVCSASSPHWSRAVAISEREMSRSESSSAEGDLTPDHVSKEGH